jgi:hypothetical protein
MTTEKNKNPKAAAAPEAPQDALEKLARKTAKLCNETGGYATKFAEDEFFEIIKSALRQFRQSEQATAEKLAEALRRAKQDLVDIQRDCNEGEFEIDPQFAIDRISAALAELEAGQ